MSTKAVIIALIVALGLGIGAYLVLQPGPKPVEKPDVFMAGEQIFKLDAAAVTTIEIESPDGEVQTIRKNDGSATYSLTLGRQTPSGGQAWPLEEDRVQNLLRVLNNSPSLDAPDQLAEVDADAMRVSFRTPTEATHVLLGSRSLGGKGLLKIVTADERLTLSELRARKGKLATVDVAVLNVFRNPGPRAWRDTTVLPGVGPDVSRVHLKNNDLSMRLARLEGKWVLREPVGAPADAAQVAKLIGTLGAIRITSFGDEPTAATPTMADTGLEAPIATVVTETDRRSLSTDPSKADEVTIKTETRELLIGKPADAAASTRYARMGAKGPVVVISGDGLTSALFDAAGYVSRKAVQAPAADIGMFVLEQTAPVAATPPTPSTSVTPDAGTPGVAPTVAAAPLINRVYRRELDKWKEVTGPTEAPLDDAMTKGVEELARFLTSEDAVSLSLSAPMVWTEQGQLVVGSLTGTPLETVWLGSSSGADLIVRTGEGKNAVYRAYQRERVPRILTVLLPKPVEAVKTPDGVKDVVK